MKRLLIAVFLVLGVASDAQAATVARQTATVDYANVKDDAKPRASGFVHGFNAANQDVVDPLYFSQYRGNFYEIRDLKQKIAQQGAVAEVVVSDTFSNYSTEPRCDIAGDAECAKWKTHCQTTSHQLGRDVKYDIWNEPNHDYFWKSGLNAFLANWKVCVLAIKEIFSANGWGNPTVVGPSITGLGSRDDRVFMQNFLWYTQHAGVPATFVTWHEAHDPGLLEGNADWLRSDIATRGYPAWGLEINENINYYSPSTPGDMLRPGGIVRNFAALERASYRTSGPASSLRVQGSGKTCWEDPPESLSPGDDPYNCAWRLDGLLTPRGQQRSAFWIYKAYGSMAGSGGKYVQFSGTPQIDGVASMGSFWGTHTFGVVLVGNYSRTDTVPVTLNVGGLTNTNFYTSENVRIKTENVPYETSDASGLARTSTQLLSERTQSCPSARCTIDVGELKPGEARILTLTRG